MNFFEMMQAVQGTNKRDEKLKLLQAVDEQGQRLVQLCMDPFTQFYVRGVRKLKPGAKPFKDGAQAYIAALERCAAREVTGNQARELLALALDELSPEEQSCLLQVLKKSLKGGLGDKTVLTAFPGMFKLYEVMLASKVDEDFNFEEELPMLAEYKLDGQRLQAYVQEEVLYFSRGGKESEFARGLFDQELQVLRDALGKNALVDGEYLAGTFGETLKSKGKNAEKVNSFFYVFDIVSLQELKTGVFNHDQAARTNFLQQVFKANNFKTLRLAPSKIVKTKQDAHEFYAQALQDKFEGLILKKLDGLYELGRSLSWFKWKPVITLDLRITGYYPGKPGDRHEHVLGGWNLEGTDENGKVIETNCGNGFSDKQRAEFWERREELIGKVVEVECQELSQAENRPGVYSSRFVTFKKFREDKE